MKKYINLIAVTCLAWISLFSSPNVQGTTTYQDKQDSIIINIDNNTKILIFVNNKEDLKNLQNYDINAMIRDISQSVDSAENSDFVKIEDQSGERYINDSTDISDEREVQYDDNRYTDPDDVNVRINKSSIKLGNYRIEVDQDEIDDLGHDLEHDGINVSKGEERGPKTFHTLNFDLGVNNFLIDNQFPEGNANYSVKPWGSWYFGINSLQNTHVGNGPLFLQWGFGLNWYNFKMENSDVMILKTENGTEFNLPPTGVNGNKSKLTASYINVSFVPIIDFSQGVRRVKKYSSGGLSVAKYKKNGLRIGVGGYAGYRLGSHTKYKFKQDGDRDTDKVHGNFNLNNFRYGVRGQIGYKGIDLFINYDMNELFNEGSGPAPIQAVSFGFIL